MKNKEEILRKKVLDSIQEYYKEIYENKPKWKSGDKINYAGRYFDEDELINLGEATLDFWLTNGRFTEDFERELGNFLGVKYCSVTNSGSSANLLAFMALTSPKLKERRINKGDEIITVACGFPTTIAPIIQYGAIPVFVDVNLETYNINVNFLEKALTSKTKAVIVAHTLGNPYNIDVVKNFCEKHNLWLIEDNCDALGSEYFYKGEFKYTGTIGDIGTSSFYPAHHITMGEGGAVYTNNPILYRLVESYRDWGRDCICKSGKDNTCKRRFSVKYGDLPMGYDHKYVYSTFGYNLKITEMQAAIGLAQLKKLPKFIDRRRENWNLLYSKMKELEKYFILPKAEENSKPSWFGFVLTIKDEAISRRMLLEYLESKGIQTRLLFAGNITKHPAFIEYKKDNSGYKIVGELINTDIITNNTFWLGVYPGINEEMIDYMVNSIKDYIKNISRSSNK